MSNSKAPGRVKMTIWKAIGPALERYDYNQRVQFFEKKLASRQSDRKQEVTPHGWRYDSKARENFARYSDDSLLLKQTIIVASGLLMATLGAGAASYMFEAIVLQCLAFAVVFTLGLAMVGVGRLQLYLPREDRQARANKQLKLERNSQHCYKRYYVHPSVAESFNVIEGAAAMLQDLDSPLEAVGKVQEMLPLAEELVCQLEEAGDDAFLKPERHPAHRQIIRMAAEASVLAILAQETKAARDALLEANKPKALGLPSESLDAVAELLIQEKLDLTELKHKINNESLG